MKFLNETIHSEFAVPKKLMFFLRLKYQARIDRGFRESQKVRPQVQVYKVVTYEGY